MKVLMIAPEPFFEPRGTPISIFQRLEACSHLGYDVDLLTYPIGQDINMPNINIRRTMAVPFIKSVKIGPSWAKIVLDILILFKAIWLLITNRYDVIHTHEEASFFAIWLSKVFRIPHLYDMHSQLSKQLEQSKYGHWTFAVNLFEQLEKWVIMKSDAIITIGYDLEDHVRAMNPSVPHIKIENLAINSKGRTPDKDIVAQLRRDLNLVDKVAIVYTGTFESYQGLDLLLDSATIVAKQLENAVFVMVGGQPEQVEDWKSRAATAGLGDQMIFVGRVPLDDALTYLGLADILVSPRTQGLSVPLKIYSYLHSRKPIVATRIEAHTQILDDQVAMLTEPNPPAYAEGIAKLVVDENLRQQIGHDAKVYANETYNLDKYQQKVQDIYQAIPGVQNGTINLNSNTANH